MKAFHAAPTPEPLYVQLKHFILHYLQEHDFQAGDVIPSENDFCGMSDVSIRTVRRALADLERDGVLCRLRGRGTFLREWREEPSRTSSGIIGIMFSDMGFVTRPTFSVLLQGMEERIEALGYHCHLYATGTRDVVGTYPLSECLPQDRPAGLIATSALNESDVLWLRQQKLPFCAFNSYRGHQVNQVGYDFASAARQGIAHFHGLGCRRIACFCEHFGRDTSVAIYGNDVFRRSAVTANDRLPVPLELMFYELPQTPAAGRKLAQELWSSASAPDGFFCTDPLTALGIQEAARSLGRSEVQLLTCYGLPDHPEIPALRVSLRELGAAAVDMLMSVLGHDPSTVQRKLVVPELSFRVNEEVRCVP